MTKPYKPDLIERAAFAALNRGLTSNSITLVYAHQHNFQGVPPYATLSIDSRTPQGQPDRIHLDDTGIMALYGTRIGSGTIMCVGDDAGDMADRIVNWLTTSYASGEMYRAGVTIHSAQPVPMMPIQLDNQVWQQACAVDFQYRCGVVYNDDVGLIQIVNIDSRIDTIKGELWLSAYTPQPNPAPPTEFMTIDPFKPSPVGIYPPPHHTVHTNQGVKSYMFSTDNPDYVDIVTAPAKLQLKKAGAAVLTITARLDDNTEVSAQTVIGCTG